MNGFGWLAATIFLVLAEILPAQPATQPIVNRYSTLPIPDGGRIVIDAPDYISGRKTIRLIFYALPNGNSIEQTAGATTRPGEDWHYAIQNIAAQTALLRLSDPSREYIVAYLEAPARSWPAWSTQHSLDAPARARAIVDSVTRIFSLPGRSIETALVAHSGGGSFVTHYLNATEPIPTLLKRVAYLDAYYGTDDPSRFAQILHDWLAADATHQLVLCAYDDRNVTLNGKKMVSDTGGSFRSAHRLLADLTAQPEPTSRQSVDDAATSLDFAAGQAHFVFIANPENRILHTRLVEWDGLLRVLALGDSTLPQSWLPLHEMRRYDRFEPHSPLQFPSTQSATTRLVETVATASTNFPPRDAAAPLGHAFMKQLAGLPADRQQAAIAQQILVGNVPGFLRVWKTIHVEAADAAGRMHTAEFRVLSDYLCIGSDADFVRVPMLPATAQQIADTLHCTMPTRKMVDDIYEAADIKLDPQPMIERRDAVETFVAQNDLIEKQLRDGFASSATRPSFSALIAGTKKDIVLTPRLMTNPHKLAIYGWHTRDDRPIQPLTTVHKDTYVDYSHGVRLIDERVTVDGVSTTFTAVLRDPSIWPLLSDEGPMEMPRY